MTLRDSQEVEVGAAAGSTPAIDRALLRVLIRDYSRLVSDRLEETGKVVDHQVSARSRRFAGTLGHHDAPAKVVASIHVEAVDSLCLGRNERRARAVSAAATLVLAEVLGHLANHYRERALGNA